MLIKAAIAVAVLLIAAAVCWKVLSDRATQAVFTPIDYYAQDLDTYEFPSDTADSLKSKGNAAIGNNDRSQGISLYVYAIRNELLSGENDPAIANLDYAITLTNGMDNGDKERLLVLLSRMFRSVRSELQRHHSYATLAAILKRTLTFKKSISEKPDYQTMFFLTALPQIILDQSTTEKDDQVKKDLQAEAIAFATDEISAARSLYQADSLRRQQCIWQATHVIAAAGDPQRAHMVLEQEKKDVEAKAGPQALQLVPLIARMALIEERVVNDKSAIYKQADNLEKIARQQNPLFLKDSALICEAAWDLSACSNQTTEDGRASEAVSRARDHLNILAGQQGAMASTIASYSGLHLN
ncbi:MAG TPA: hypothetical protein V6C72_15430 [Chroococcales cyanobacterium]